MESLDQIGLRTGTDKSSRVNDYLGFYEELFGYLRHEPISILEIGVLRGDSLAMWEQAFPRAEVTGADKVLNQCKRTFERAKVFSLDAGNQKQLRDLGHARGPFDIIIEDSAHVVEVSQAVIDTMFLDFVKPGGWLVIEDIAAHWKRYPGQNAFTLWALKIALQTQLDGYMRTTKRDTWPDGTTEFQRQLDQAILRPGILALRKVIR